MLNRIVKDRTESAVFRGDAIDALAWALGEELSAICKSDANVREAIREEEKQTDNVVNVSQLVRSGEVNLTDDTIKAWKPTEARIRAYIELLGTILADEENEPEELRKEARRRLEGYRKSALTGIDDDVDEALRQGTD
jgi:predicted transcriptional regulator